MKEKKAIKRMLVKGLGFVFIFCVVALLWNDKRIFWGTLVGSLIAYANFALLCVNSKSVLDSGSLIGFYLLQASKYVVISIILIPLLIKSVINPIACVVGLNILWLIPFTEIWHVKNV